MRPVWEIIENENLKAWWVLWVKCLSFNLPDIPAMCSTIFNLTIALCLVWKWAIPLGASINDVTQLSILQPFFFAEDPYYWGLRARIPNFVKSRNKSKKGGAPEPSQQPLIKSKSAGSGLGRQEENPYSLPPHPFWWHNRMYHGANNDPAQMSKSILFNLQIDN